MNRLAFIISITIICGLFVHVFSAWSQEDAEKGSWTGKLKDGTVITYTDLKKILKDHERLNKIDEEGLKALKEGRIEDIRPLSTEVESIFQPVDLAGADLRNVDLSEFNLVGANLQGVNFSGANLYGTYLRGANLSNANLAGANLIKAHLNISAFGGLYFESAILSGAEMTGANLSEANLQMVDLSGARLNGAILRETILSYTDLTGAKMRNADLTKAKLTAANLENADLRSAQLEKADLSLAKLWGANLSLASLKGADLSNAEIRETKLDSANLEGSDLTHSNLIFADLRLANLIEADLRGARLIKTDFTNAILYNTTFMGDGLLELVLTKSRMSRRDSERLNACYVRLAEWATLATEGGFYNIIKSLFNLLFLELTGQYGLKSGRPIIILICLIPYFAFFYIFAVTTKNRKTGICVILSKERPFKLTEKFPRRSLPAGIFNKIAFNVSYLYRIIRIGLYFSLLSAFNIGWQEINTKYFITRLQRRDYTLRATGWARSLAGIQSLLSIFLLSLWLLTIFGNSF
jgi:uncharacterized protein YjbI with pentapeptide repeats